MVWELLVLTQPLDIRTESFLFVNCVEFPVYGVLPAGHVYNVCVPHLTKYPPPQKKKNKWTLLELNSRRLRLNGHVVAIATKSYFTYQLLKAFEIDFTICFFSSISRRAKQSAGDLEIMRGKDKQVKGPVGSFSSNASKDITWRLYTLFLKSFLISQKSYWNSTWACAYGGGEERCHGRVHQKRIRWKRFFKKENVFSLQETSPSL